MTTEALTLGGRIRVVRGDISQERFAKLTGVSLKTEQRYERDETGVDTAFLQAICRNIPGINPIWLLMGEGPMYLTDTFTRDEVDQLVAEATTPAGTASAVDENLLARVGEEIVEMYRQENARLSQRQLARLQARLYGDLVAAYNDQAERLVGLKGLIQQLRRDLRTPPTSGDTDKRLA